MIFTKLAKAAYESKTFQQFYDRVYMAPKLFLEGHAEESKRVYQTRIYPVKVDEQDYIDTRAYAWLFYQYENDTIDRELTVFVHGEHITSTVYISTASYYKERGWQIAAKLGIEDNDSNKLDILDYISENLNDLAAKLTDDEFLYLSDEDEESLYQKSNETSYTREDYLIDEYECRRHDPDDPEYGRREHYGIRN